MRFINNMVMKRILLLVGLATFAMQPLFSGQADTLSLSLRNVVDLAINQSSSVKYEQNQNVNYYWRWKNFQASFRPQLTLTGNLPDFAQTTNPITQPDGSIEFKQISQMKMNTNLSLSQTIPMLGTYIYAATSLYRVQDFYNQSISFSGSPVYIGFYQPIFAVNYMKWSMRTEPLLYEEAQKDFIQSVEEIAYNATSRFFRYLQIQTNYTLAENNLRNSQDNLKIAEIKKELGNISENDFSRIKLSVYTAQKALNTARINLKNADFELKSYIGLDQDQSIRLIIPLDMMLFSVDPDKALAEALENRKENPRFERRLIEAERDLTIAKRNNGLSASLNVSYGLANSSEEILGVYDHPEQQKQVKLSMSVPIMDWGRSASQVKLAESKKELTVYDVEKEKADFEREVVVQVEQFNLIKTQIETAYEADKVAENGYLISLKRFQNGEISITDLNISLSEREAAKRDYISSLENYWKSYYMVRILTLYDFEMQNKIFYNNPMLRTDD